MRAELENDFDVLGQRIYTGWPRHVGCQGPKAQAFSRVVSRPGFRSTEPRPSLCSYSPECVEKLSDKSLQGS